MKEMIPRILEWIYRQKVLCTTLDENGNIVRKDDIENNFGKLGEFLNQFSPGDIFVIESRGFALKLANPLKIKLIAESRMKNDDVDSEILAKLLRNDWIPESYVPSKDIREIRRIVRTRIQISQTLRSYKNRIRYELLRMHVDYEV
jgi:transposase